MAEELERVRSEVREEVEAEVEACMKEATQKELEAANDAHAIEMRQLKENLTKDVRTEQRTSMNLS